MFPEIKLHLGDGICQSVADGGISLRDWFAGMAIQGVCSEDFARIPFDVFARASYRMADAMLAARNGEDASK